MCFFDPCMQIPCDRTQIHGCVQCSSYAASRKTYMCYFTGSRCSAPDTGSQCTPDDSLCCCGFGHIQHQKTQDAVARTCLCRSHDVSKHLKWMQKARIFFTMNEDANTIYVQGPAAEVRIWRVVAGVALKVTGSWKRLDPDFEKKKREEN